MLNCIYYNDLFNVTDNCGDVCEFKFPLLDQSIICIVQAKQLDYKLFRTNELL